MFLLVSLRVHPELRPWVKVYNVATAVVAFGYGIVALTLALVDPGNLINA